MELNLEDMKNCYGMLFQIENKIRNNIKETLVLHYGDYWVDKINKIYKNNITSRPIDELHFHELINFLKIVPEVNNLYEESTLKSLSKLTSIRNKIAHSIILTDKEMNYLNHIHNLIKK